MAVVHKSVFLGYSAQQMFDLVARVEDYPKFLPWCGGVKVLERDADTLVASPRAYVHALNKLLTKRGKTKPD